MVRKPIEILDLPPELLEKLIEKCDLISRCKLRATSSTMNHAVSSTKLFIPSVYIKDLHSVGVLVKLTFKLFKDVHSLKFKMTPECDTRISQSSKNDIIIEGSRPIDEAIAFLNRMCFQNNVVIGFLTVELSDNFEELNNKFMETLDNMESSLKVQSIFWRNPRKCDLLWKMFDKCDGSLLNGLKIDGQARDDDDDFDFLGKNAAIVQKMDKIEISTITTATYEDVMALKASVISLKSKKFTGDLICDVIEKFVATRSTGSKLDIMNPSGLDFENIPAGFTQVEQDSGHNVYHKQLPDDQRLVVLWKSENWINLEIGKTGNYDFSPSFKKILLGLPHFADDSSEYDDNYDDYDNDEDSNFDPDYDYERYEDNLDESDYEDTDYGENEEFY
ncbi:F-box domain-containing protein [Caenorhabditis elegans]|uniref:F-box domain-containing protein n=1 Tax=Caenorhabditis elegans TaxID=6239 RepID=O01606_CAEEL|nr:F-box domain-containing protein [Caenorhabditis elegans]CCD68101.1 F-box domain-containing protein [Caenorhabditis elegans]|eukprot:NP_491885.1 Uncharacterized protein CELE_T10E9.1 [Caenorhabditis elegans]